MINDGIPKDQKVFVAAALHGGDLRDHGNVIGEFNSKPFICATSFFSNAPSANLKSIIMFSITKGIEDGFLLRLRSSLEGRIDDGRIDAMQIVGPEETPLTPNRIFPEIAFNCMKL